MIIKGSIILKKVKKSPKLPWQHFFLGNAANFITHNDLAFFTTKCGRVNTRRALTTNSHIYSTW